MSSHLFNEKTGLAIVCPITNTDRNWPLHVRLPEDCALSGVIMVELVKSLNYASRKAKFFGQAPVKIIDEVPAILDACIFDDGT